MNVAGPSRTRATSTPSPNGKRRRITVDPEDVIEVSSDSDDGSDLVGGPRTRPRKKLPPPRKAIGKKRAASPPRLFVPQKPGEVFEISDDEEEEDDGDARDTPETKLKKELKEMTAKFNAAHKDRTRYHKELATLRPVAKKQKLTETQLASAQRELTGLKAKPKTSNFTAQLDEMTNCEICCGRMWVPIILPECGHTFCSGCLKDWFQSILNQHKVTHPHYTPGQVPAPIPAGIQNWVNQYRGIPGMEGQITQMLTPYQVQAPTYTCPTCREAVKTKPSEDYKLKELIHAVAGELGVQSPKKVVAPTFGRRGAVAAAALAAANANPFNAFFPSKR